MKRKRKKRKQKILSSKEFQGVVWSYYKQSGRHSLEWRRIITPYRVLVSELMLQQTQVSRVGEYFPRFVERFPGFNELAKASQPEVLAAWQGLGYNRRAIFLHRTAKDVVEHRSSTLPADRSSLEELPGIGPATSGALMAFAFNQPVIFIETNIRRVYLHHFFSDRTDVSDVEVLRRVEETLPRNNFREWYWALMDYGAALPKQTKENPNTRSKHYTKQSKFEGSVRQVRGAILRRLLRVKSASPKALQKELGVSTKRFKKALVGLEKEGVVAINNSKVALVK